MYAKASIPLFPSELRTLVELIDGEIFAYRNYVVTNVEEGNFDRATELTKKLREYQDLRLAFSGSLRAIERASIERAAEK